ncbi:Cupin domain protein [Pigmentiphaga humi]|uniref:Cupin domain protein n=1 Tax=Pigmentiphaga humi TaxID=2478468 RepID=A0A3P4B1N6_9BURK|nr:cupin domain-containing protein [Pigmentiphaga humi]VCU69610.1 Cupin domain protein [Pigmentiphaga humi]
MQTLCPTQEEMQSRIARFDKLKPRASHWNEDLGIPAEVLRIFNPKANYVLMAPASLPGRLSPNPAIVGGDQGVMRIGLALAAPNDGPELHVHWKTHETFMALSGRWLIRWGDEGQESIVLEPYDMIAMPPRVARQFINISDQDAHLLVFIQGQPEDFDDVGRLPSVRQKIIDQYGADVLAALENNGWDFSLVPKSMREGAEA